MTKKRGNNKFTGTANTRLVEATTIPEIAADNIPEAPAENDSEENINEELSANNDDNTQQIEFFYSPLTTPDKSSHKSIIVSQIDDNTDEVVAVSHYQNSELTPPFDNNTDEVDFKNSPLNRYNMFKNNGMTIGAIVVPAISLGLYFSTFMAMAPSVAALVGTLAAVVILSALVGVVIGGFTGASIELFISNGLYPSYNNNIRY